MNTPHTPPAVSESQPHISTAICDCVKACQGMADPITEIARLRAQRDELLKACKRASAWMACNLFPNESSLREEVRKLHVAIDHAEQPATRQ